MQAGWLRKPGLRRAFDSGEGSHVMGFKNFNQPNIRQAPTLRILRLWEDRRCCHTPDQ